jgi:hypothetical protein
MRISPAGAMLWQAVGVLVLGVGTAACSAAPTAGFWYSDDAFTLSQDAQSRLAGPLTNDEAEAIQQISRAEIEGAFTGLNISVTSHPRAFWRVVVVRSLAQTRSARRQRLPAAAESIAMGFLGGSGAVDFDMVTTAAVQFAPLDASRQEIVTAIGRGIGRTAVHEFMHQMLGPTFAHNDDDPNSYEHSSPDRPSQYWGELHWTTAWPLLRLKFGQ